MDKARKRGDVTARKHHPRLRGGSHEQNNTMGVLCVKVPLTGGVSYVRARFNVATKNRGWGSFFGFDDGGCFLSSDKVF